MSTPGLKTHRLPDTWVSQETRLHFQLTIMANRYPNDPFNHYSSLYQPGTSINFPGSGSTEFFQFPGFYYSSHGMQQNHTVQTLSPSPSPSLPIEPSNPRPSTQKSRERWQTRDEAVLVQLWTDNIERLESKDSSILLYVARARPQAWPL